MNIHLTRGLKPTLVPILVEPSSRRNEWRESRGGRERVVRWFPIWRLTVSGVETDSAPLFHAL